MEDIKVHPIDFSKWTVAELMSAAKYKGMSNIFMGSWGSEFHSQIGELSTARKQEVDMPGFSMVALYDYITLRWHRHQKEKASASLLTAAASKGMMVVGSTTSESVVIATPLIEQGRVRPGEPQVEIPLKRGTPVITLEAVEKIKAVTDIEPIVVSPLEISLAAFIADHTFVDQGRVMPKNFSASKAFVQDERVDIATKILALRVEEVLPRILTESTKLGAKKITMRGQRYYNVVQGALVGSKHVVGYQEQLAKLTTAAQNVPFLTKVTGLVGDYEPGTAEYAWAILEATRAVRGGDDKDSTFCGSSTYLPYNIERELMSIYQRFTDAVVMLKQLGYPSRVNIVGTGSNGWVAALLAAHNVPSLKLIGVTNPTKYSGFTREPASVMGPSPPEGSTTSGVPTHVFVSTRHNIALCTVMSDAYTIDVEPVDIKEKNKARVSLDYQAPVYRGFKKGYFCRESDPTNFIPSCYVHNLTGFYCSTDITLALKWRIDDYIKCSVLCNYSKTVPSRSARAYTIVSGLMPEFVISSVLQGVVTKGLSKAVQLDKVDDQELYELLAIHNADIGNQLREEMKRSAIEKNSLVALDQPGVVGGDSASQVVPPTVIAGPVGQEWENDF